MRAVVRRSLHVVIDEVRNINHVPDGEFERAAEGVFGNGENTNLLASSASSTVSSMRHADSLVSSRAVTTPLSMRTFGPGPISMVAFS